MCDAWCLSKCYAGKARRFTCTTQLLLFKYERFKSIIEEINQMMSGLVGYILAAFHVFEDKIISEQFNFLYVIIILLFSCFVTEARGE